MSSVTRLLQHVFLEWFMSDASIGGKNINNLGFVDDIGALAGEAQEARQNVHKV